MIRFSQMESAPKRSHLLSAAVVMIVVECNRNVGETCTWTRSENPDGFDEFIAASQTLLEMGAVEGTIAPDGSSVELTLTRARLLKMNEQLRAMLLEVDNIKPGTVQKAGEFVSGLGPGEPTNGNTDE